MQTLRNAHLSARCVLVWFVLSIGVAIASPLVKPQTLELSCSGAGVMTLRVMTDDGSEEVPSHTLKCPLCMQVSAPASVMRSNAQAIPPLDHVLQSIAAAPIAALTAVALPHVAHQFSPEISSAAYQWPRPWLGWIKT